MITEKLARFVIETRLSDIPNGVRAGATRGRTVARLDRALCRARGRAGGGSGNRARLALHAQHGSGGDYTRRRTVG